MRQDLQGLRVPGVRPGHAAPRGLWVKPALPDLKAARVNRVSRVKWAALDPPEASELQARWEVPAVAASLDFRDFPAVGDLPDLLETPETEVHKALPDRQGHRASLDQQDSLETKELLEQLERPVRLVVKDRVREEDQEMLEVLEL